MMSGISSVLDAQDLVLQVELHLLEAAQLQLIAGSAFFKGQDGHVEIAMLLDEFCSFDRSASPAACPASAFRPRMRTMN